MPYLVRSTITYPVAPNTSTHEYAFIDADGDGDLDALMARFKSPAEDTGVPMIVLLNDGGGSFTNGTATIFPSGAHLTVHPRGLAIADFNGDGRFDLFIADHGSDTDPFPGAQNSLLLSSGIHGFVTATTFRS